MSDEYLIHFPQPYPDPAACGPALRLIEIVGVRAHVDDPTGQFDSAGIAGIACSALRAREIRADTEYTVEDLGLVGCEFVPSLTIRAVDLPGRHYLTVARCDVLIPCVPLKLHTAPAQSGDPMDYLVSARIWKNDLSVSVAQDTKGLTAQFDGWAREFADGLHAAKRERKR